MISPSAISPLNKRVVEGAAPFSFGNALQFDGVNDFVSITNLSNLSISNKFSVSFWCKMVGTISSFEILTQVTSGTSYQDGFGIYWNNSSSLRFWVNSYNSNFVSETVTSPTNWKHYVAVYDGTLGSDNIKLYIDSVSTSSDSLTSNVNNTTDNLIIGRPTSGTNPSAIYDEYAIWNEALSQSDVNGLFSEGNGDFATNYKFANLQVYYRMNGVSGDSIAVDEQGNYNGTLTNFDTATCWVAH